MKNEFLSKSDAKIFHVVCNDKRKFLRQAVSKK